MLQNILTHFSKLRVFFFFFVKGVQPEINYVMIWASFIKDCLESLPNKSIGYT